MICDLSCGIFVINGGCGNDGDLGIEPAGTMLHRVGKGLRFLEGQLAISIVIVVGNNTRLIIQEGCAIAQFIVQQIRTGEGTQMIRFSTVCILGAAVVDAILLIDTIGDPQAQFTVLEIFLVNEQVVIDQVHIDRGAVIQNNRIIRSAGDTQS